MQATITDLSQVVERHVQQRAGGRVHRLEVEVDGDRVVVRGCTHSYYAKQLAIQGCLDALAAAALALEVNIQVLGETPAAG